MHFHACEGTQQGAQRRLRRGSDVLNRTGSTRLYPPGSLRSNISLPTADEHLFASIRLRSSEGNCGFTPRQSLGNANASDSPVGWLCTTCPLYAPGPAICFGRSIRSTTHKRLRIYFDAARKSKQRNGGRSHWPLLRAAGSARKSGRDRVRIALTGAATGYRPTEPAERLECETRFFVCFDPCGGGKHRIIASGDDRVGSVPLVLLQWG